MKAGKRRPEEGDAAPAPDLADLDLSDIRLSDAEVAALSGLTPALSRRLQRQLFAQLPPAAARELRRTLSLQAATPRPVPLSESATLPRRREPASPRPASPVPIASPAPLVSPAPIASPALSASPAPSASQASSASPTPPDRPLLSKYLTPERDDSFSSDGGSILSEPSYLAAYGRRAASATRDATRKRFSRFLRPDFFDAPLDDGVLMKHKKEKELETQEVLREIREKKNKGSDRSPAPRSPTDSSPGRRASSADLAAPRKCFSPVGAIVKERSRSNTPFYPILDNIREAAADAIPKYYSDDRRFGDPFKSQSADTTLIKESKLIRPKSYPVKNDDQIKGEINDSKGTNPKDEVDNKDTTKESRLLRPRSYPASSPSPEKVYANAKGKNAEDANQNTIETKTDVEVTFNVSLPKKVKPKETILEPCNKENTTIDRHEDKNFNSPANVLKKYEVVENKNPISVKENSQKPDIYVPPIVNGKSSSVKKSEVNNKDHSKSSSSDDLKQKINIKDDNALKSNSETGKNENKPTIKKKIIRKVSSKTKADSVESNEKSDSKVTTDKKKVIKKLREKINDDIIKNNESKKDCVIKKKSVLQTIGQKFEKFTSPKATSLDKDKSFAGPQQKKEILKKESSGSSALGRNQREQSVPAQSDLPTESNLIKRAVTITDVAGLEQTIPPNKTTVSKVLGLFKKFDSKDKINKIDVPKSNLETSSNTKPNINSNIVEDKMEGDKPKRPTSLLLNGLGRKYKYGRTASDSVSVVSMPNCTSSEVNVKKDDSKNIRNSLKLDFSRLPRVKKIIPTNPVIEPQVVNLSYNNDKETDIAAFNKVKEPASEIRNIDIIENRIRSRSRSKSDTSHSESKSDKLAPDTDSDKCNNDAAHHPLRNHEPTTPEKEDIGERIRRKSFYTRFNEKRQRRKSNLVGPGAAEYDPVARLHSQPGDSKYDVSPTSPVSYDLSPGYSPVTSDLSPSTERYRSLNAELPMPTRNSIRYDNYGIHDKIDSYRSLDRSDLRKYSNNRSYADYETPSAYTNRYSRTLSLLDGTDANNDAYLREPHKYNRTLSLYAPGSYATYRPNRTRNSAIILKESEKEPSPENILDKIRQKKISISVTRKPDPDKEPLARSNVSSKGEGDSSERVEKVD